MDHWPTLKYALGYWNSTIGYQIRFVFLLCLLPIHVEGLN